MVLYPMLGDIHAPTYPDTVMRFNMIFELSSEESKIIFEILPEGMTN